MTDRANHDRYALSESPQSVMTLDSAIATHPALWARMLELRPKYVEAERLDGMVEALAIVGGFDMDAIWDRLTNEAPPR